ncbi:MAG TPA: dTDP-4-amino-4,6-dideoxygalactose transaminase [Polyangiaceae bacterium LLY-WYZ-14_1]|nr:dTDP-4-amino-4,6-dideoxygalactose transaminase [Polyangiaceae bacterium LLY-WYZ-14_1]
MLPLDRARSGAFPRAATEEVARDRRGEPLPSVPLHRRYRARRELAYLGEVLVSGQLVGDGAFTDRCHRMLRRAVGGRETLLTGSCTTALEMAALLCREPRNGGGGGDEPPEVIVPGFTFVSTANAFVLHGFRPVFADVLPETGNLDPAEVARRITPRTRAVVAVHYAGVPCAIDALRELADAHGLWLVEDAAHALYASYGGRPVGALGDLATLSFHDTKNLSCGEGGALVFDEARFGDRPRMLRQKGTNRDAFLRKEVSTYDWVDVGGSYLPSELQAAVLLAQLEDAPRIQAKRRGIHRAYLEALAPLANRGLLELPCIPDGVESAHHLFAIRLPDRRLRDELSAHLRARNIGAVFHYLPLHLSPFGQRFGEGPGSLPEVEGWSARVLRLPLHPSLSAAELDRVVEAIAAFFG